MYTIEVFVGLKTLLYLFLNGRINFLDSLETGVSVSLMMHLFRSYFRLNLFLIG